MHRIGVTVSVCLVLGCKPAATTPIEQPAAIKVDTSFGRLPSLLKGVQAGEMSLFEGLPSPFWEPEAWGRESSQKAIVRLEGYLFYEEPLELAEADAEQLTALLSARNSYQSHRADKRCGEYHPDYGIEWKSNSATTRALISLECEEVVLVGPEGSLRCDIAADAAAQLKSLLGSYELNRPATESTP